MVWIIALFIFFSISTSVLVVAACMNSSRISQEDPWSEEPLYEQRELVKPLSSRITKSL
jgi:hypothetical protein